MKTIQWKDSSASEIISLFEVIQKHGALCNLEFWTTDALERDPYLESLFTIAPQPVKAEYLESDNTERAAGTVVIYLGESEFGFNVSDVEFSSHISKHRIEIMISSRLYDVNFESGVLPCEAIQEARDYLDTKGVGPLQMNEHEEALIRFIRTLDLDDLEEAKEGIFIKAGDAGGDSVQLKRVGEKMKARKARVQEERLDKLARLLCATNGVYRNQYGILHPIQ
ncbi:hypothetical protein WJ0W_005948 [Paenibacillus melissococcoides]|uniref:Uncharacterized protein n=1 Tax=Paenibacillus melissococcoides TaxID=2912268 RepID=A0ABN8UC55_9BACL|nr:MULTISPECIES: hypothetical protein [Paenibacillus]MEB9896684.1 hypothetical protein [Bacillus cereus]QVQ56191.1 hypothetical protein [Paenibacillus phage Pd_22F]CAH8248764.1 hypothetical protein WJ0W_005948 [Paenibacillus melissococcoides]CAH8713800.1 hypothetical protein WDD9_003666 [Paenibacillus melissococcoides]CAH8720433.1 hypothetical protein HTL2_005941 [Paenibacillus melissococcoides]